MATDIVMPRLSDSMEEGTILRWIKSQGDEVALACDHRVLYGADGAEFLARVRELLTEPLALAL